MTRCATAYTSRKSSSTPTCAAPIRVCPTPVRPSCLHRKFPRCWPSSSACARWTTTSTCAPVHSTWSMASSASISPATAVITSITLNSLPAPGSCTRNDFEPARTPRKKVGRVSAISQARNHRNSCSIKGFPPIIVGGISLILANRLLNYRCALLRSYASAIDSSLVKARMDTQLCIHVVNYDQECRTSNSDRTSSA